jgi:hypothetical protein
VTARKAPDLEAAIRERVLAVIASRDLPPGRHDLCHLCAGFASEHDVNRALADLLDACLIRDEIVSRSHLPGGTVRMRVYHATVASRHARRNSPC